MPLSNAAADRVKAWCNYHSIAGTPTIIGSFNISSITDNAVGDFTFNFTNALPDTNYAISGSGSSTFANQLAVLQEHRTTQDKTTGHVRVSNSMYTADSFTDVKYAGIVIHGA